MMKSFLRGARPGFAVVGGAALLVLVGSVGSNALSQSTAPSASAPRPAAAGATPSGYDDPESATLPPPLAVGIDAAPFGKRLADRGGMTLYAFSADPPGASRCVGRCERVWPPVRSLGGKPQALTGVQAGQVGSIQRADGSNQVTFNGHPLYFHDADTKPGQTTGQGRSEFGGRWSAVPPQAVAQPTGGR